MNLLFIAFFAGVLTVLTPCVLPVLPVILGGSLSGQEKYRPLIITASLMVSVFLFTLLLKASTALINIPPQFWTWLAGGIVLFFGLTLMFPDTWSRVSQALGLTKSEGLLQKASQQGGTKGTVLLGMALGPVFASCSPTYALILAVVLPQSFSMGITALIAYCVGLFVPLFLIGYGGRKVLGGFRWFANPQSFFKKGLGLLLVVVGVLVLTGVDKKLEAALLDNGYFDFTTLEQGLVDSFENGVEVTDEDKEMAVEMAKEQNAKMPGMGEETDAQRKARALLNVNYVAPELVNPQNWINSDPLTLSQLQQEGKVVVIDFWTYSCINCIRTLPALKALHEKYADDGLVIIGVHAPEFAFERVLENLQREVRDFGIEYPVFQDNDFATWRAYKNRYWPAKYIIDKQGNVRYTHFGEGGYEETEQVIQYLLGQDRENDMIDFGFVESSEENVRTGETYLGTGRHVVTGSAASLDPRNRQAVFVSPEAVTTGAQVYSCPDQLSMNEWCLKGEWIFDEEKIVSVGENAAIVLSYEASEANLVMGVSGAPVGVSVLLDGDFISEEDQGAAVSSSGLSLSQQELYYLSEHDAVEAHDLELQFNGSGVELYAWTFG